MIRFNAKTMFFDLPTVKRAIDKGTQKVLRRFGFLVRRRAKQSIRKRSKSSRPGKPPSSHTGLLKKFIYFGFDPATRSVVIGPEPLSSGIAEIPRLLEQGGTAMRRRGGKLTRVTYEPRPYMGPAYEWAKPKVPALWRDSIR